MSLRRLHHEQPASFAFTPANADWPRAPIAKLLGAAGSLMPVLARLRYCVILMYFEDHNPPHFHVRDSDGREAEIRLGTLEVLKGRIDRRAVSEALEWARGNEKFLEETWDDFFRG